ncbi:MAG TPA: hypothetical protein VE462_16555 [Propionibacteriaceae bacterium]|nr:hypothetical protein [Propionibacteriaceae bacterium]
MTELVEKRTDHAEAASAVFPPRIVDLGYRLHMAERSPEDVRRLGRLSWITFLGGICLLGVAVTVSMLSLVPELVSTIAAILGVLGMFSGLVAGVLIVLNRDRDE